MSIISTERLKELRKVKGSTQKEMAELLSLKSDRTYRQYEAGEVDPPTSKSVILADYFNVSLDYLIGRTDLPDIVTKDKNGNFIIIEAMTPPKDNLR